MHLLELSAADLVDDLASKFGHAAKPAFVFNRFELNKLFNISLGLDILSNS